MLKVHHMANELHVRQSVNAVSILDEVPFHVGNVVVMGCSTCQHPTRIICPLAFGDGGEAKSGANKVPKPNRTN